VDRWVHCFLLSLSILLSLAVAVAVVSIPVAVAVAVDTAVRLPVKTLVGAFRLSPP